MAKCRLSSNVQHRIYLSKELKGIAGCAWISEYDLWLFEMPSMLLYYHKVPGSKVSTLGNLPLVVFVVILVSIAIISTLRTLCSTSVGDGGIQHYIIYTYFKTISYLNWNMTNNKIILKMKYDK